MADILTSINTRKTPQSKRSRGDQVKNAAGGYVFQIGDLEALHRFLTLGTDSNTFYTKAQELTEQNAQVVFRMAANRPDELIAEILSVSQGGRAPKNKQAIFALAIAASAEDVETRQKALAIVTKVCRTATHLFQFNTYVEQFRGRGRALNTAVGRWYKDQPVGKVAYQAVKYRSRENWAHRDLLRLAKGKVGKSGEISASRDALYGWIANGDQSRIRPAWNDGGDYVGKDSELAIVVDYLDAKDATTAAQWAAIVNRGHGVSWEMLPDAALGEAKVWEAMLEQGVPNGALIRNLGRLTTVFKGPGDWSKIVAKQIKDADRLKKGRVHPINVLIAMRTYAQGHGEKGKLTWTPLRGITDALDEAFYAAYGAVEPSGKRRLIALDISGSMHMIPGSGRNLIAGLPITPREASSAIAMVTLATEPDTEIIGFSGTGRMFSGYSYGYRGQHVPFTNSGKGEPVRLDISPRRRLDDICEYTGNLPYGDTDCALPFTWAQKHGLDFDSVEIYTDNESWSGPIHVHQAAEQYRNHIGHDVKLVACAMTATNYSVVDPKDASGLNVSGFDSATPQLIADFAAGRL